MEQDTVVVPTGEGTTYTTHQGGAGANFNHNVGPLYETPPGGSSDPDTSATSGYPR